MDAFLRKIVEEVQKTHAGQFGQLCFVLPNRRAGLFLKKYLAESGTSPQLAPATYSMEEFLELLSGARILEPITILFEFYNHFRETEGDQADPLDEFVRWAPQLLSDFNEVDLHLVRPDKLFQYVNESRALELWSVDGREMSETQRNYLKFWESIYSYYKAFTKRLEEQQQAYSGLAARWAANKVEARYEEGKLDIREEGFQRIIFAGFNALSPAEEKVIRTFIKNGQAEIYWDTDAYYMANNQQEAGLFFRRYREGWAAGKFNWIFDDLKTRARNIDIIGVASHVGQAKVAGEIISELDSSAGYEDTAVVLIQENLLIPTLQSLPEQVKYVNVTMGYPLRNAPLHGFLNTVFLLQENAEKMGIRHGNVHFYHKDLVKLLGHPFLAHLPGMNELSKLLIRSIRKRNLVFIPPEDMEEVASADHATTFQLIKPIFKRWKNEPIKALTSFREIFENLKNVLTRTTETHQKEDEINLEYLYLYTKILKRMESLIGNYRSIRSLKTLRVVFNQLIGAQSIPFYGEPLRGLQVMGLLETRLLDFKNVVVLSANEDKLPTGKTVQSFIPFDIRREFGLPTHKDRDSLAAYHFYRLLQRAENISILYNTEPDEMGGGEKSRFITQIEHELPLINPATKLRSKVITFPVLQEKLYETSIEKSTEVLLALDRLMEKGLSPSALNKFIQCPLDFYYKYIIGLRDEEEVEETIEATTLGSFVHGVLETFYTPFIGKAVPEEAVTEMLKAAEKETRNEFLKKFRKADLERGKNLLTLKVAIKFVRTFLQRERTFIRKIARDGRELEIVSLEQKLEKIVQVNGKDVRLIGLADRIDKVGDLTRIIDYKTGMATPVELKVTKPEKLISDASKAKAFQLMTYALLHREVNGMESGPIVSGIVSFRKLSEGVMAVKMKDSELIREDHLDYFEEQVQQLVSAIYDTSVPFSHEPDANYCSFCGV